MNNFNLTQIINDEITFSFNQNEHVKGSFCTIELNQDYINFYFSLDAQDCLFDLNQINYEFHFRINKSYLNKYQETIEFNIHKQAICCNTQSKLLEIIQCNLSGIYRKLYLESILLYLVFQSQKNNLIFQLQCDQCAIANKPLETEKIMLAKKYILDHLEQSLTIPLIAQHVGTNQCYLKKGFKEIFQQTVYEYVQEQRMTKARHLLQASNSTITEIAYSVGYSSLSSFSQAFKNYYGVNPSELVKQSISLL